MEGRQSSMVLGIRMRVMVSSRIDRLILIFNAGDTGNMKKWELYDG